MDRKIKRVSLVDQVYSEVLGQITSGELGPGARLNIEDISKLLGVSRTPVREAISRLIQDGYVEQKYNAGPSVISFSIEKELDLSDANDYITEVVMSQRGGSVTTQIRYGDKVNAPVIGPGEADLIVSFEEEETYRWMKYLKPGGKVVLNKFRIPSSPILTGEETYPEGLIDEIKAKADTTVIPASEEAEKLGSPQSMNIVLLGALVKAMGLTDIDWDKIMSDGRYQGTDKGYDKARYRQPEKVFQTGHDKYIYGQYYACKARR